MSFARSSRFTTMDGSIHAIRAFRIVNIPVVITREEVSTVQSILDGKPQLVAKLLYGSGRTTKLSCRPRKYHGMNTQTRNVQSITTCRRSTAMASFGIINLRCPLFLFRRANRAGASVHAGVFSLLAVFCSNRESTLRRLGANHFMRNVIGCRLG